MLFPEVFRASSNENKCWGCAGTMNDKCTAYYNYFPTCCRCSRYNAPAVNGRLDSSSASGSLWLPHHIRSLCFCLFHTICQVFYLDLYPRHADLFWHNIRICDDVWVSFVCSSLWLGVGEISYKLEQPRSILLIVCQITFPCIGKYCTAM